jgi:hypothetical protein
MASRKRSACSGLSSNVTTVTGIGLPLSPDCSSLVPEVSTGTFEQKDQKKELIYTDRFVKITTEDQIVQGYGLESDPRLSKRKIKNLSATIYINDVP